MSVNKTLGSKTVLSAGFDDGGDFDFDPWIVSPCCFLKFVLFELLNILLAGIIKILNMNWTLNCIKNLVDNEYDRVLDFRLQPRSTWTILEGDDSDDD